KGAIAAGESNHSRFTVPVIFQDVWRSSYTSDDWLALLREHNTGREKSFVEMMREKLVDIDPDEAASQIEDDHIKRTRARVPTIKIGTQEMKRYAISPAKRGMADAILEVLNDLKDYLPVSLRAVHYRLLVKAFFRNSKLRTPYLNDLDS